MTYDFRYNIGSIEDTGLSPYRVAGNPVIALIAQLNRFAGRTVNPGGGCTSRDYLPRGPLPLVTALDDKAATTANLIMYDRLNCLADVSLIDHRRLKAVREALVNAVPWAMANLATITTQIAQFADSLGLSPAAVGITKVDPKMTPKMSTTAMLLLGVAGVAAVFMIARRKR